MKAADRKSGAVGDIDILSGTEPIEAVEVKLGVAIRAEHVGEAMEKIKAAQVERYFILSTAGIDQSEAADIQKLQERFKLSNGCEIIVNGVLESGGTSHRSGSHQTCWSVSRISSGSTRICRCSCRKRTPPTPGSGSRIQPRSSMAGRRLTAF
jgi:hypothetical protein